MIPRVLKNFQLFVDGRGYAGRCDEVKLPQLSVKTDEYRGGGLDAPVMIDLGMEAMEATFAVSEFEPVLWKEFGLGDGLKTQLTVRGALKRDGDAALALEASLRGAVKQIETDAFQAGERAKASFTMAVRYCRLAIDGVDLVEIDIDNMKRVVNGTDQLADIRAAIGL